MTIHSRIPSQGLRCLPATPTQVLRIAIEYLGKGQYRALDATPWSPSYGKELVARTNEPLFASARVLIDQGHDLEAMLEMTRTATPETVDMRCHLGAAAKLTVHEPPTGSPRIAEWKPSPFRETAQ